MELGLGESFLGALKGALSFVNKLENILPFHRGRLCFLERDRQSWGGRLVLSLVT